MLLNERLREKACRIQIQVSAGLFVPLFAHLTRAPTLNSEFPKTREYNIVYTVKSQKVLGDYQCLLRITFTAKGAWHHKKSINEFTDS